METNLIQRPVIVPCGGKSLRMGRKKGLVDFKGQPWLLWQLKSLHAIGLQSIVVVLGFEPKDYESLLDVFQRPTGMNLSVIQNNHPKYGPFSSLITGYRHLNQLPFDAAFFLPLDVPCPEKEVWELLENNLKEGTDIAIPSKDKKGGHPVLLSSSFLENLSPIPYESIDARLDLQIRKLPKDRIAYVDVADSKIQMNLNTPSDFGEFQQLVDITGQY